ncbi:MAG: tetratricopeptide repeat protein, partial [Acidobacteriota bacterium]
ETQAVLKLNPFNVAAHATMSALLAQVGNKEASIQALEDASSLSPDDIGLLYEYASALQKQGRFEEAADAFARYLSTAPDNVSKIELKQRILKLRQWARGW